MLSCWQQLPPLQAALAVFRVAGADKLGERDARREAKVLAKEQRLRTEEKKLNLLLHPDKVKEEGLRSTATEAFKVLRNAYDRIKDCK